MIPPVEERAFRACNECVFSYVSDMGDTECKMHVDTVKRFVMGSPCIYNYTDDEMNELLDPQ
jgi:hypothetical protein